MAITKEAVIVGIILGAGGFYLGRSTGLPPPPQNYNDCVLEAMKQGSQSMEATMLIHHACEGKFGRSR